MKIKLDDIHVDFAKNKSRQREITTESVQQLRESIATYGLDTPVKIRPTPDGPKPYELFVGFRRFTAVKSLGLEEIEATVCDISESEAAIANLRENLERENLSFFEEACALKAIFPPDMSIQPIAKAISRSRNWVRPRWLLWTLPDEIIVGVQIGEFHIADVSHFIQVDEETRIAEAEAVRMAKLNRKPRPTIKKKTESMRSLEDCKLMMNQLFKRGRLAETILLRWVIGDYDADMLEL